MIPLRRAWRQAQRFTRDHRLVVLSDYDGTLTAIVAQPSAARLSAKTRRVLARLSRAPGVVVGVVSGRVLFELKRLVRLPRLVYIGNHGLEVAGCGLRFRHPEARRACGSLRRLVRQAQRLLRGVPGAWGEWKGLTMSLHWRNVPSSSRGAFHRLVRALIVPASRRGRCRVVRGKRVVDVRPPVDWNKGSSIDWLLSRWRVSGGECRAHSTREPRHSTLHVVYLGDDRTDEDAFRAVNRRHGWSVFVGAPPRRTAARYRLGGPAEVTAWLSDVLNARANVRRVERRAAKEET